MSKKEYKCELCGWLHDNEVDQVFCMGEHYLKGDHIKDRGKSEVLSEAEVEALLKAVNG